jgi:UDP-N-acetyl-D-mannosaminuronic acid transferase (WecB/TagA/CpsF family)
MILGFKKRAPKIFIALGIEWLWRLLIDGNKTRMMKRIWRAIFVFLWEVSKEK